MSSNKTSTPRPTLIIPEYSYQHNTKQQNNLLHDEKHNGYSKNECTRKQSKKTKYSFFNLFSNSHIHIDETIHDDNNDINDNYFVLHGQDTHGKYSNNFFKVKHIVRFGIFFDMIATFLFFIFNSFFLFLSFFNLLFVYLGWHGVKSYDSSYLGSYTIYMFMKIVSMLGFFVYVCINISSYFHQYDIDDTNSNVSWFCTTYSFFMCLYLYFYINTIRFIKLLLR